MLHPQARAALAEWAQQPSIAGAGPEEIAERRRQHRTAAAAESREDVASVRDVDADGVVCRLYLPQPRAELTGAILFLHGGGFVFGDLDTHDPQSRRLANRTGLAVLAVDYRRPPEHRFPAAPDDVDTALAWLMANGADAGVDVTRVVALGDSAGGNLALVAALRNPNAFAALVLVYPFLDPERGSPSYAEANAGLTAEEAAWYWQQYAGSPEDLIDPDLAPLRSERLDTLPPSLVVAAEHDVLVDEDEELARRIGEAGGDVELSTYPGMVHGFWRRPELFDAAEASLAEIAAFLDRTF
ncbi:MAG TPA: alpha/beta hydrolase [Nocardioidaceae bacterium]|nr:alpha/beta hydrolase [Nocardioidaceae bacterium]